MPRVTIVSHTQDALELLLFTKNTRLNMSPEGMEEVRLWPEEKKLKELEAMARTIRSSWEFVSVTFALEGVSRSCAQQITRTRNASYAMQSQRVTDASGMKTTNSLPDGPMKEIFESGVAQAMENYSKLVAAGAPLEDARGILPMNVQCNLVAQYNLRALTDVVKARRSLRAQGEYNSVAIAMYKSVIGIWPWTRPFFKSDNDTAIEILEEVVSSIGMTTGKGPGWEIAKAVDLLRKG